MRPKEVHTAADARQIVEERDLDYVKIGFVDIDGIVRGKLISRHKFFGAIEEGIHAVRDLLGFGIHDDGVETKYTGWHTGFPDAPMRIVPETCRGVPFDFDGRSLFFLCEYDGEAETYCSRSLLRRIVSKARAMGFVPYGGFEYEFFLFKETPHSVRDKGYQNLTTSTPGNFGYSVVRETVDSPFYQRLLSLFLAMDVPLEGCHEEVGPGAMEAAITAETDIGAADRAVIFKTFTKIAAQREGLIATFMARWDTAVSGQGAHMHLSLRDPDTGRPRFHLDAEDGGMNATLRHFLAGQQALLPEFFALIADHQFLPAFHARGMGADRRELGHRKSHLCASRHPRPRTFTYPGRVPGQRRRRQSLPRLRGGARGGSLRHRTSARAAEPGGRKLVPQDPGRARAFSGDAGGSGPAAATLDCRPQAVRRCLSRLLRDNARGGSRPVPPRRNRLGTRALLRDHLRVGQWRSLLRR